MPALRRSQSAGYALLFLPALALSLVLLGYPFVSGIWLSFTDASPLHPVSEWVGLDNYDYVLGDPTFWTVAGNSFLIIGISVVAAIAVGLALALLLHEPVRLRRLYRTLIFQVWVVPWISVAVLWGWLFNFDYGIVNYMLQGLGVIDHPLNWLADPTLARFVLVSGFAWRITPFMMVTLLAALQGIPIELYESAMVDGASYRQRLRHITLPMIGNVMVVLGVIQAVRLFQEITMPLVTTQGGPVNATTTLSIYTYKMAFEQWDFGSASAIGCIWSILLIGFTVFYVRALARGTAAR
jgi:multiple sugar transport system permease protein